MKGVKSLITALEKFQYQCPSIEVVLLAIEGGSISSQKIEIRQLGFLSDQHQITLAYSQMDLFVSLSQAEHEAREFEILQSRLTANAIVLSDNSHATTELANWSLQNGRRFMYFAEEPLNHWYQGAGIGISTCVKVRDLA